MNSQLGQCKHGTFDISKLFLDRTFPLTTLSALGIRLLLDRGKFLFSTYFEGRIESTRLFLGVGTAPNHCTFFADFYIFRSTTPALFPRPVS